MQFYKGSLFQLGCAAGPFCGCWGVIPPRGDSGVQAGVPLASSQSGGSFSRGACWGRVLLEQTPLRRGSFPEVAPTFRVTTHHGPRARWPTRQGCACHAVFLVPGPCWPGTFKAVAGPQYSTGSPILRRTCTPGLEPLDYWPVVY